MKKKDIWDRKPTAILEVRDNNNFSFQGIIVKGKLLKTPYFKGVLRVLFDLGDHSPPETIELPENMFRSKRNRLFAEGMINYYRRLCLKYIPEQQKMEERKEELLRAGIIGNSKRYIDLQPFEYDIKLYIRNNVEQGKTIDRILKGITQQLKQKHNISVSVPTLRKKGYHKIISAYKIGRKIKKV